LVPQKAVVANATATSAISPILLNFGMVQSVPFSLQGISSKRNDAEASRQEVLHEEYCEVNCSNTF
jgi:hypothetical protein